MRIDSCRIGVMGGTFNPIHNAHIAIAKEACAAFSLDKVLLMVANDPPHKHVQENLSPAIRFEMTKCAADGPTGMEASDLEIVRAGTSYMADTLEALQTLYPDAALYLIVGGDMLSDLPNWRRAADILRLAQIVGAPRAGMKQRAHEDATYLSKRFDARVHVLDIDVPPISSTMVRQCIYDAEPISDYVPLAVELFIYEEGLYLPEAIRTMHAQCRARLKESRFSHVVGVWRTAAALAQRYGVDADKTRTAAILHDYGRSMTQDALLHAVMGAELAKNEMGVQDEDVLSAIRYHTTLRAGASRLEQLIYVADMIEPGRDFRGVERLRDAAQSDLLLAAYRSVQYTVEYVRAAGQYVDQNSIEALEDLSRQCREKNLI